MSIVGEYCVLLIFVCAALIYPLPVILLRKLFFRKMIINEDGFTIYYRNKIVKQLLWENIKEAKAIPTPFGGEIDFTDTFFYTGKDKWKNKDCIFVNLKTNFAIELYKYKDKIPVKIKDLDRLSYEVRKRLS